MPPTSYVDLNTIHDPATGTAAPAAWGDAVRDDLQFLYNRPGVRCFQSLNQTTHDGIAFTMPFDSELGADPYGLHDTTALTTRITIPAGLGGGWLFGANIGWSAVTNVGRRYAWIEVNGSGIVVNEDERTPNSINGNAIHNFCGFWFAGAGDYFELKVLQTSGVDVQIPAASYLPSFWAVQLVGA